MNIKLLLASILFLFYSSELRPDFGAGDYFWMLFPTICHTIEKSENLNDKITTVSALAVGAGLITAFYTILNLGNKALEVNHKAAVEKRLPTHEELSGVEKDIQTKTFIIKASLISASVALVINAASLLYPKIS